MSFGGFINVCAKAVKFLIKNDSKTFTIESAKAGSIILGFGTVVHSAYAYGTVHNEKITVDEQYQLLARNGSLQMIRTKHETINEKKNKIKIKDVHYAVPPSLWFWQFKSPELWRSLEAGKTYNIKTYGWRVPLLGIFPNIVDAKEEKPISASTSTSTPVNSHH